MSQFDPVQEILKISKDIGSLQSELRATNERLDGLEEDIKIALTNVNESQKDTNKKIDQLIDTQRKLEGGWRALTLVGGGVVVVGGVVAWFVDKWETIKNAIF